MQADTFTLNHFHGGKVFETARKLNVPPESILDFSANINPLGPPPGLKDHLFERFERVVHYPEMGAETLTRALEERWGLPTGSVLVGNGSTSFIYMLPAFLGIQRVRIAGPAFGEYENACRLAGCSVQYSSPPGGPPWRYDTSAMETLRVSDGPSTLWVANPANPTGQFMDPERMLWLVRRLEDSHTILVLDEAFIEFQPGGSLIAEAARRPNLLVLRSATKIFALPGLRLGWIVAHPDLIRRLAVRLEPWAVNMLAQEAGLYCLGQDSYVEETVRFVGEERDRLTRRLESLSALTVYPSSANYVLVRLEDPRWNAPGLARELEQRRILIRDCTSFPGVGERFVRLAVRKRRENELLSAALQETLG